MSGSEYFDHTTYPAQGAPGSSSAMRAELDKIEAGFGKLPDLSGNGGKLAGVKADASGMEAVDTTGTGNAVRATDPTFLLTDTTVNDASTLQHGWMKKLPGSAGSFYNGQGNFVAPPSQSLIPDSRTGNSILVSADQGHLIKITSGTFTQTVTAAATLGNGWYVMYQNTGTGYVTIDPNGAETINGASTLMIQPDTTYFIISDGTNLLAVLIDSNPGYLHVIDQKASGVTGGALVAGAFAIRELNTLVGSNTITGSSLGSNQIILPAGTYEVDGWFSFQNANGGQSHIYNVTDSVVLLPGGNIDNGGGNARGSINGRFTLSSTKTIAMRTYSQAGSPTAGLAITSGQPEVYTSIRIKKVA